MELPNLYEQLLRASKITNYLCPSTKKTSSDRLSVKDSSASTSHPGQQSVVTSALTPPIKAEDTSSIGSCDSDSCVSSGEENYNSESWWKNPIAKSSKM